jgi:hypothetical protein
MGGDCARNWSTVTEKNLADLFLFYLVKAGMGFLRWPKKCGAPSRPKSA